VRNFARAVRTANAELLVEALNVIEEQYLWTAAMRAVAQSPCRSNEFRGRLLDLWLDSGDRVRNEVNDDLLLIRALRAMLPRYNGPAVKLYRGETFWNRRRRTYGIAWTTSAEVARDFANERARRGCRGGSVLIETLASPAAVICAPAFVNGRYGEREYLVDRRRLRSVTVLERFEQCSPFSRVIT